MTKKDILILLELHFRLETMNYYKRFSVSEEELLREFRMTDGIVDYSKIVGIKEGLANPWMPDISKLPEAYVAEDESSEGFCLTGITVPNKPDRMLRDMKLNYARMSTPMIRYKDVFYTETLLALAQPIIPKAYGKVLILDAHFGFLAAALEKQKYVTSIDIVCIDDSAREAFVATTLPTLSDKVHLLDVDMDEEQAFNGYDCVYCCLLPERRLQFSNYCWVLWLNELQTRNAVNVGEVDILGEDLALAVAYCNICLGAGDAAFARDCAEQRDAISCVGNYVEYKLVAEANSLYHKGRVAIKEAIVKYIEEALELGYPFLKEDSDE